MRILQLAGQVWLVRMSCECRVRFPPGHEITGPGPWQASYVVGSFATVSLHTLRSAPSPDTETSPSPNMSPQLARPAPPHRVAGVQLGRPARHCARIKQSLALKTPSLLRSPH